MYICAYIASAIYQPNCCRWVQLYQWSLYNITSNHLWSHPMRTHHPWWTLITLKCNPLKLVNEPVVPIILPLTTIMCMWWLIYVCGRSAGRVSYILSREAAMCKWNGIKCFAWSKGLKIISENICWHHTYFNINWLMHTIRTNTDNYCTQRQQRQSRLVAVLPPPGTFTVSSHLITTWPCALAVDGWRSMNLERERDCVQGLTLAMIPPPRFYKDMQCMYVRANTHVWAEAHTNTNRHFNPLSPYFHLLKCTFVIY